MSDHNRERWEREAAEAAVAHVPKFVARDTVGETRARADGFSEGYRAAAERYAPRWVKVKESHGLVADGWRGGVVEDVRFVGDDSFVLLYSPAPDPPGGEG